MATRVYDYPEGIGLVICGDIHGKFDELVYRMTVRNRMEHMLVVAADEWARMIFGNTYFDRELDRHVTTTVYFSGDIPEDVMSRKIEW